MSLRAYLLGSLGALVLACIAPTRALAVLLPVGSAEGKPDDPSTFADCTVLRWRRQSSTYPYIPVREPGKYCLDRDYTADLRGCTHGCLGQFIDIRANDVEIDLRGHTLAANRPSYSGIQAVGNNITIRNGRIKGGGAGVIHRAAPPDMMQPNARSPDVFEIASDRLASRVVVYGPGRARIEQLLIEDVLNPIAAAGANVAITGNTIRSPIAVTPLTNKNKAKDLLVPPRFIETSPLAMISVYGPGSVVEGNTIEQKNRTGGRVATYAILLRDGHRAIVRNNRIRNVGSKRKTFAVGLKDSTDVIVDGNELINIESSIAALGPGSSYVEQAKR